MKNLLKKLLLATLTVVASLSLWSCQKEDNDTNKDFRIVCTDVQCSSLTAAQCKELKATFNDSLKDAVWTTDTETATLYFDYFVSELVTSLNGEDLELPSTVTVKLALVSGNSTIKTANIIIKPNGTVLVS